MLAVIGGRGLWPTPFQSASLDVTKRHRRLKSAYWNQVILVNTSRKYGCGPKIRTPWSQRSAREVVFWERGCHQNSRANSQRAKPIQSKCMPVLVGCRFRQIPPASIRTAAEQTCGHNYNRAYPTSLQHKATCGRLAMIARSS